MNVTIYFSPEARGTTTIKVLDYFSEGVAFLNILPTKLHQDVISKKFKVIYQHPYTKPNTNLVRYWEFKEN